MPTPSATPLYLATNEEPSANGPTGTPFGTQDAPTPPYIPGGFPRNGFPTKASAVILYINLFLASLYPALGLASLFGISPLSPIVTEIIGLVLSVWFVFYVKKSCAATRGLFPILLLAGIAVTALLQTAIPTAILLSVLLVISHGAMLMAVARRSTLMWLPLIPIAAGALSLLLCTQLPALALSALLPWPTAAVIAVGVARGAKHGSIGSVGLMCLSTLTLSLTLAAAAAGAMWGYYGEISLDLLSKVVESIRTACIRELMAGVEQMISMWEAQGAEIDELAQMLDETVITDSVNAAFNLIPGTLIATLNVFSFLVISALTSVLKTAGYGSYISREMATFRMTPFAAVTFFLAFFLALLLSNSSHIVGAVAQNILLIFEPGLAFCGFAALTSHMMRRKKRSIFPFLLLAAAVAFFASVAVIALAVYGAVTILFASITSWIQRRNTTKNSSGH